MTLLRFLIVMVVILCLASKPAESQQTYNQWDREQALARDVSFVTPQTIHPASDGTTVVLEVKEAVNTFNGVRLRHRSYNGGLVGPIIRVKSGATLRVRLENHLDAEPPSTGHGENVPHGFNTTNLHTHGLHVSPESPADDVFREVAPGGYCNFEFEIPVKHPAGTFWYHAHKHGSTAYQLASGMAGALIVDGGLDDVPEIQRAEEKIMVLQQFVYRENTSEPATVNPDDVYKQLVAPQTAINGQVTPTIVMQPGEVQRWRLIHGGIGDPLTLKLDGIPLHEIALDGLALGTRVERSSVELFPGQRCDVLIKAPAEKKSYLMTTEVKDLRRSFRKRIVESSNVLKLVVTGSAKEMALPTPESLASFAPFKDSDVPNNDQLAGHRTLRFKLGETDFLINDEPFNANEIKQTIRLDTAEEWKIVGEAGGHPFHIHVNPFAVQLPEGDPSPNRWVWRDTFFVQDNDSISIRSWFRDFTGKTVLHCHILDHEDQGMMQAIRIVDQSAPVTANESSPISPDWSLAAPEGSQISSESLCGRMALVVLHRGFACEHCAQQIKLIADRHQDLIEAGLTIVAISPELPAAQELKSLKERWKISFSLLQDPDLGVFSKFGCLAKDGSPLHGAFLITPTKTIAARFVGPEPVTNLDPLLTLAQKFRGR